MIDFPSIKRLLPFKPMKERDYSRYLLFSHSGIKAERLSRAVWAEKLAGLLFCDMMGEKNLCANKHWRKVQGKNRLKRTDWNCYCGHCVAYRELLRVAKQDKGQLK